MSAIEDPGPGTEPGGPARPSDELEGWLSDLRTEVSADPSGWITKDSAGEPPTRPAVERSPKAAGQRSPEGPGQRSPEGSGQRGTETAKPSSGGRHRAAD
jgi:hypothetical protein